MKQILAIIGAAVLIAGAFFVRARLDDDGSSSESSTAGQGAEQGSGELVVVCASELAATCSQLAKDYDDVTVRTEEAQTTLDRLVDDTFDTSNADFDAWLTIAPYPAMAAEQRQRALLDNVLAEPSPALARSPLVLVGWNDRLAPLTATCADNTLTWSCIGTQTGTAWSSIGGSQSWGVVKPGQASPDLAATGLLTIGQATGSYFGRTDYAANDFVDPGFRAWFEKLERGIPDYPQPPRTPLDEMLSKGPSTFDVAGSIEAIAAPAVARSRDNSRLTVLYPSPVATADVVLVPIVGTERSKDVTKLLESNALTDALTLNGWRIDGQPTPTGGDPSLVLPAGNGLPKPGVLEALRTLWLGVVR